MILNTRGFLLLGLVGLAAMAGCGDDGSSSGAGGSGGGAAGTGGGTSTDASTATGTTASSGTTAATCAGVCDKALAAQCEDVEPDCTSGCEEAKAQSAAIGCGAELDAFIACIANAPDVCDVETACKSEGQAFASCFGEKCSVQPTPPECGFGGGGGGAGGFGGGGAGGFGSGA